MYDKSSPSSSCSRTDSLSCQSFESESIAEEEPRSDNGTKGDFESELEQEQLVGEMQLLYSDMQLPLKSDDQLDSSESKVKNDQDYFFTPSAPPEQDPSDAERVVSLQGAPTDFMPKIEEKVQTGCDSKLDTKYRLCGLSNPSFLCFSNTCLQMLYTAPELKKYFLAHRNTGPFHKAIAELFRSMEQNASANKVVEPYQFNFLFRRAKPQFADWEMHDAQEYLTILLEMLHEEGNVAQKIKPDKKTGVVPEVAEPESAQQAWEWHVAHVDNSFLSNCLMGQMETCLRCLTCARQSLTWSAFWQLQLQLPELSQSPKKELALSDCLVEFTAEETLGDVHCSQCGSKQPATKRQTICRPSPLYLVVHLKRFDSWGRKNYRKVSINDHLHLNGKSYALNSAVLHMGNEHRGHYVAVVRTEDNHWVAIDDERVSERYKNQAAHDALQSYAYLCLYKVK